MDEHVCNSDDSALMRWTDQLISILAAEQGNLNVIDCYYTQRFEFPSCEIAMKTHSIPATFCTSERGFSTAGNYHAGDNNEI